MCFVIIVQRNRSSLLFRLSHLPFLLLSFLSLFRFSLDPLTVLLQCSQLSFQRLQLLHQFLQFLRLPLLFSQLLREFDGFMVEF